MLFFHGLLKRCGARAIERSAKDSGRRCFAVEHFDFCGLESACLHFTTAAATSSAVKTGWTLPSIIAVVESAVTLPATALLQISF